MVNQYINVYRKGTKLLVASVDDNKKTTYETVEFRPHLYHTTGDTTSEYRTIFGSLVSKVYYENMYEMQKAIKEYGDISQPYLFGLENPVYQFLVEEYGDKELLPERVNIPFLDIEINSLQEIDGKYVDGGFPVPESAEFPITAICQYNSYDKKYCIFTTAKWKKEDSCLPYRDQVLHVYARDEKELIQKWLKYVEYEYPHVWTGWNVELFDFPYIVNRIKKLFGDREVKRLSPWGIVQAREGKDNFGNTHTVYEIVGSSIIDMQDAYKKYRYKPREKYALGYIMKAEFPDDESKRKLEFKEETHGELYYNNPQLHTDYCCGDVYCTVQLEDTLQFIALCISLSYSACVNIGDNFSVTKIWDVKVYKESEKLGIAIPLKRVQQKQSYPGAYVFDTVNGFHKAIISEDLTSLYPSAWRFMNCGPETVIQEPFANRHLTELKRLATANKEPDLYEALVKKDLEDYFVNRLQMPEFFTKYLQEHQLVISPICVFFDVSKQSLMSSMVTDTFMLRKSHKKARLIWEKRIEKINEKITEKS